jgi:hypothetical protein
MREVQVAVIGAGPHGLSAGVHLRRAGQDVQVYGEPMSFWRGMPEGMKLRSNMSATNMIEPAGPLSLHAYARDTGHEVRPPVPLERFIDYGLWVQRHGMPDVDTRHVTSVQRDGLRFELTLSDGEKVSADRVVVAGGIEPFAHVPEEVRELPAELVTHTGQHADLAVFAGRRVAVVGGGQSAFESAVLLQERGAEAELLVRATEPVYLRSWSPIHYLGPLGKYVYAPTDVGPLWYSRLVATPGIFRLLPRDTQDRIASRSIRPACSNFVRVRLDPVKTSFGLSVRSAVPSGDGLQLTLSDGSMREVDHLMVGTGYRVDVTRYAFLGDTITCSLRTHNGYPVLRRGLECSVPGLHFTGAPAAWSFGPIMRFVSGSWYGGRSIARGIAGAAAPRVWHAG